MLVATNTGTIRGIDGLVVRVEVDVGHGLQTFRIVGLPDAAVREAQARVRAALSNSGFGDVEGAVTVNLAPADVKKQGTAFDLAVALGLVAATGQVASEPLDGLLCLGELALDGSLRPVSGVLPAVSQAARRGIPRAIVPHDNAREAALVEQVAVFGAGSLREAVDLLSSSWEAPTACASLAEPPTRSIEGADLAEVKGQRQAKRALEIAAAGGHNLLMSGPPGSGKSMLAKRLPSLLPPLDLERALEVTKVYSVAGLLEHGALVATPPFRAPHHSISAPAMVGGGSVPRPGEISLAHHGVLFLDELPEFPRSALESLRQPLEEGRILVRRVDGIARYPARFALVAAMNPCPCGFLGVDSRACGCSPSMIQRYRSKISGPLLDRIDLRVPVRALGPDELLRAPSGEPSSEVRRRVELARGVQQARFRRRRSALNAFLTPRHIERYCPIERGGRLVLRAAVERFGLSARAYHRVLKVARTIADLSGSKGIEPAHLQEALVYRTSGDPPP